MDSRHRPSVMDKAVRWVLVLPVASLTALLDSTAAYGIFIILTSSIMQIDAWPFVIAHIFFHMTFFLMVGKLLPAYRKPILYGLFLIKAFISLAWIGYYEQANLPVPLLFFQEIFILLSVWFIIKKMTKGNGTAPSKTL